MDFAAERCASLHSRLNREEVHALVVSNPVNVSYLTNFSGESSFLVLTESHRILITDGRFTEQLAGECPGLELVVRPPSQSLYQATIETLIRLGCSSAALESNHLTIQESELLRELGPALSWKLCRDWVEVLRIVKNESEIAAIREAIHIAERAFQAFRSLLRREDNEKDLADAMEAHIRRVGGRCASFPSIVAVGDRSALPHAPPTQKRVEEADFLLLDWGASGRFYNSDLTRMLLPCNNPAFAPRRSSSDRDRLRKIFEVVLRAQERAIRSVRPGMKCMDLDAEARTEIADAGYGEYFNHGLGHGIGRQIHEAPAVRPRSETVLRPGMVITIEPGIYIPGFGGVRIEDDVLVTPDGYEVLTHLAKSWESSEVWV